MTRPVPKQLQQDLIVLINMTKLGELKTLESKIMKTELNHKFEMKDTATKEHAFMFLFSLLGGLALAVLIIVTAFNGKLIDDYLTKNYQVVIGIIWVIPALYAYMKFGKKIQKWVGIRIIKFKKR